MRQIHVIYLILISGFLLLRDCQIAGGVLAVQLSLTFAYIGIEILSRYLTFRFYIRQHRFNDAQYYCWNTQDKGWQQIEEKNIKVGHIIKVKKIKNESLEQSQQIDQRFGGAKVRVPVNLLPIRVSSGQKNISIETFDTDKQQAAIRIPLIPYFEQYIHEVVEQQGKTCKIKPRISDQVIIQYTFSNPVSQSFEANICFLADTIDKKISNTDAIPRGAYFCNEKQLIGLVLYNLQQKRSVDLKHILGSKNGMANVLQRHLIDIVIFSTLCSLLFLGINALISAIKIGKTFHQSFHCYFFNYMSLFYFATNVVMYILLGLHQIIDSFLIRKKSSVRMNNYIKSIDQFGVVDTFVMDQFTFIKKNILQVSRIDINQEQATKAFDQETILIIIEKSQQFQAKYQNQWLALNHYYRSKYGRGDSKKHNKIVIKNQKIDISGCIRLEIALDDYKNSNFVVRLNEKVIFSVLDSMQINKKNEFQQKIMQGKSSGQLMFMIQILELKSDLGLDTSKAIYQLSFKFLSLIKLRFLPRSKAVDFLRYLKNKYKVFIMTSSPYEYFDKVMFSSNLKGLNDIVMNLDQIEEKDLQRQLEQKLQEYKKKKQKLKIPKQDALGKIGSQQNYAQSEDKKTQKWRQTVNSSHFVQNKDLKPSLIIALDSSLIVYLGRPTIRNLLQQLSKYSTYVIFYNCTQFQKQLCAASIFKTFPQHIFISNFAIDVNIFRISNLSMCIQRHSAQRYVTATALSYTHLQKFISKQCVTSIQLTTIIIKTHVFKNQCLVWSMFTATILVYQGSYMFTGQEYSPYVMYLFNVAFTILPIFYYLIGRPEPIGDIMVEDYKDYKLRYENIKGMLCGMLLTYVSYAIIPEDQIKLVFVAVMINCTFMANFYHLVLDDSANKNPQIVCIIIQSALSIGVYFLTLFVGGTYNLFMERLSLGPNQDSRTLFFCCVFLLNILVIFMAFFFMSFHKSIHTKDQREQKKILQDQKISQSTKKQYTVAKVEKSSGKQMKFRAVDYRNNQSRL